MRIDITGNFGPLHSVVIIYSKSNRFYYTTNLDFTILRINPDAYINSSHGRTKMLSLGIFFSCAHIILYNIAWARWIGSLRCCNDLGHCFFSFAMFKNHCIKTNWTN